MMNQSMIGDQSSIWKLNLHEFLPAFDVNFHLSWISFIGEDVDGSSHYLRSEGNKMGISKFWYFSPHECISLFAVISKLIDIFGMTFSTANHLL
jgi:hypothetical protein